MELLRQRDTAAKFHLNEFEKEKQQRLEFLLKKKR